MKILSLIAICFLGVSCASVGRTSFSNFPTQTWAPGIYDVQSGKKITESELLNELNGATYILIGESHDSESDHRLQLRVVNALLSSKSVVGFEMFQRPFQKVLNDYSAGKLSEEEMLLQSEWDSRWGFNTALYSPIWTLAKKREAGIIALNLRRELTKRIAAKGIHGLSPAERADLPTFDLSNDIYKNWLEGIFTSHGAKMSDQKMQNFFEAQVLWDETMADSAVRAARERSVDHLIAIVGRGHFEWDWGIPSRIRRRLNTDYGDANVKVLIPSDGILPNWETLKKHRFADYIWVHQTPKD